MGKNDSEIRIGVDLSEKKEKKEEEEKDRETLGVIFHSWKQNEYERMNRDNEGKGEKEKAFKCNVSYSYCHDNLHM